MGCGIGSPTQKQAKPAQFQGMPRIGAWPRKWRPYKARCFERVALEFLIQLPFPPNRVDGGIEQQLENEGSADPTHHRSKSKSLRIFVT